MATAAVQRPFRGSRVSTFYPVKSLPPLSALESAFQLQEYISLLIRLDVHDVDTIVSLPGKPSSKDSDEKALDSPENDSRKPEDGERKSEFSVDRACWIYEQLRRLAQDLSHPLITMLQQECTRNSCPQMKAGEWLYLCVAHGNDGAMEQCCAIDYILHTLDSATALLNSPRAFPSRLSIPQTSFRHFSSLARRLGRIFAHAYFHHREAFEQAEAESSLYARFLKLTSQFDLVPAEFLVIPESAVHHDGRGRDEEVEPPRLLAAAVHPPAANFQHNELPTERAPPDHQVNAQGRSPVGIDNPSPVGTDSPRRLGRSRTDTMVFSEAFQVAEELVKGDYASEAEGSHLLDSVPTTEPESFITPPQQSWPENQSQTEELNDEDIGEVHEEEPIQTGSLSPPVEELPLISLEETTASSDLPVPDAPSEPESINVSQEAAEEVPAPPETSADQEVEAEHPAPAEPFVAESPAPEATEEPSETPSLADVDESPQEPEENEASDLSEEPLAEAPSQLEVSSEEPSAVEAAETTPSSPPQDEPEAKTAEPETQLPTPAPEEYLLDLSEPPPSEPVPPESESDITDEAHGLDGDEVTESGGDGEVDGE
ncbi:hypothetical protein HYDPIDRAFT_113683 [Hydnomerulius pinastri MD-312]|uniref:Mob1/phocein n=1 Tax=Hydnomerulius pinastri MD-312 TaxID=994086 RepID=A0A0C9VBU3_9AGAM|nr:hypothetical protein HYDPIDRAFT_113683 [Hydnomerulius pinastri MD-312]